MTNKQKNFYKLNEIVELKETKETVKVLELDTKTFDMKVSYKDGRTTTIKFWDVRKLQKRKPKYSYTKPHPGNQEVEILVAKLKDDAKIPTKRDEDAGYDIFASLDPVTVGDKTLYEIVCPKLQTTLVPTGLAMAFPKTHYLNLKHERGSTAKVSMSVLAGVWDSGYRDEAFVAITPLYKDVVITNVVEDLIETKDAIYYPYSKAICQGTVEIVPKSKMKEVSYETVKSVKSERGMGKLGSSGK